MHLVTLSSHKLLCNYKKGQEGVHNYTVEEVKGTDATVTYDTMKANVTVTVKHDGTAKVLDREL